MLCKQLKALHLAGIMKKRFHMVVLYGIQQAREKRSLVLKQLYFYPLVEDLIKSCFSLIVESWTTERVKTLKHMLHTNLLLLMTQNIHTNLEKYCNHLTVGL